MNARGIPRGKRERERESERMSERGKDCICYYKNIGFFVRKEGRDHQSWLFCN